jgi:hypothetical protein
MPVSLFLILMKVLKAKTLPMEELPILQRDIWGDDKGELGGS